MKKEKKKKNGKFGQNLTALAVAAETNRPRARKIVASVLTVLLIFGFYRYVVYLVENSQLDYRWLSVLMWTYLIAGCAVFVAVFVLQRGFSNKPLSAEDLPDSMSIKEKQAYLDGDKKRKHIAKYLMVPLFAIVFVFFYEIIELYYFPMFQSWFS